MSGLEFTRQLWLGLTVYIEGTINHVNLESYTSPKKISIPSEAIHEALDAGYVRHSRRTGMITITDAGLVALGLPTKAEQTTVRDLEGNVVTLKRRKK